MVCSWEWTSGNGAAGWSSAVRWANLSLFWVWWNAISQARVCGIFVSGRMTTVGTCPMKCFCSYSWREEPPVPHPLSLYLPLSFSRHTGCQAALTMNQSLGGFFDCRWGEEVTGVHGFRSLSAGPCALNNSLTYHFFSWDWEKSLCGGRFCGYIRSPHW